MQGFIGHDKEFEFYHEGIWKPQIFKDTISRDYCGFITVWEIVCWETQRLLKKTLQIVKVRVDRNLNQGDSKEMEEQNQLI